MDALFGPDGALAAAFDKYEHRPGQARMAERVLATLADDGVALIEAPTGTGKTIAYLIPAVLSGRHVVVSTGTKALQEQIVAKDIPLAARALGRAIDAVVIKGRRNYLCRRRFAEFEREPTFAARADIKRFTAIQKWAERTPTGDRAEIADLPDDSALWRDICAAPETCLGGRCPTNRACFIGRVRARAAKADLVVVNHHLLFADLAVRMASGGEGQALPEYDAVICDEAHQIEDAAVSFFGKTTSSWAFDDWERNLDRALGAAKVPAGALEKLLIDLHGARDTLFTACRAMRLDNDRLRPENFPPEAEEALMALRETADALAAKLETLGRGPGKAPEAVAEFPLLARRIAELARTADEVCAADDRNFVYWREQRQRTLVLHKDPIDLAGPMQDSLFAYTTAVVFTSATLSTQGDFRYIKSRLGITFDTVEEILPTCFDYARQGLLYLPGHLPDPRDDDFLATLIEQIASLVRTAGGRSLCLFTSIRNMEAVYHALKDRLPFPCMLQGQAPKHLLLERKRREPETVLFATASFWEGVDVPGEALRCVVIDKLPFASPSDPLVAARMEKIEADGGEPFNEYQLPAAIIMLKQGLGRLIRTSDDRGVLALLDSRLRLKSYGKRIIRSLPPFAQTSELGDVLKYWENRRSE